MNKIIAFIDKVSNFFTLLVVSCILLVSSFFLTVVPQAGAKPLTPEARSYNLREEVTPEAERPSNDMTGYYRLNSTRSPQADDKTQQALPNASDFDELESNASRGDRVARNVGEKASNGVQSAMDNVREKLNLDQPIYPGTKEFINDVEERVETAIDNTKNALTGAGEDAADVVRDSYKRVDE